MRRGWWVVKCIVIAALAGIVIGLGTQMLWNWLVPGLFNGPVITFWQAVGLLVLSKVFFWSGGRRCHCGGHRRGPWRGYWKEKLSGMTPEEKEAFKKKMKDRWCQVNPDPSGPNSGASNV